MISKSEKSYISTSLLSTPPLRADGRALRDYRPIALELTVAPLANGSARVRIGGNSGLDGAGRGISGTEVIAAAKLEVENVSDWHTKHGRLSCAVSCSPAAFPSFTTAQLDDLQTDLSSILDSAFSDPSLLPSNLTILPGKKSWLLHIDALVLNDDGNVIDALFLATAAALKDTRIPRTKPIEFRATSTRRRLASDDDDPMAGPSSGLDTRAAPKPLDFELADYWDEGEALQFSSPCSWPLCISLNLVPPIHYLDATSLEESSTSIRLLLFYSFLERGAARLQGMRLLGHGEADSSIFKALIREGEGYARELRAALDSKLQSEVVKRHRQFESLTARKEK